jgi:hypothetical protein
MTAKVLAAFLALGFAGALYAQDTSPRRAAANAVFVDNGDYLRHLEISLSKCRAAVLAVDADSLPVEYKEGKLILNNRELCLRWLRRIEADIASLQRKQTLSGDLELVSDLKSLNSNMDALSSLLSNLITHSSTQRSMGWAEDLERASEDLFSSEKTVTVGIVQTMRAADDLIAKCQSH